MVNAIGISPLQETTEPLSDEQIVSRLRMLCRSSRRTELEIIRLLVILQSRHLELAFTHSSLYEFCAVRLGMTAGEATRRVAAARLIRKIPALHAYLEAGKLSMTTLLCLRDYVTAENANELLASVANKSRREVELVLAARLPNAGSRRGKRRAAAEGAPSGAGDSPPMQKPARYSIEIAVGSELDEKIQLARRLLAKEGATEDVVTVLEAALDVVLADLRARGTRPDAARPPVQTDGAETTTSEAKAPSADRRPSRVSEIQAHSRRKARRRLPAKSPQDDAAGAPVPPSRAGRRSAGPRKTTGAATAISDALHRARNYRAVEANPVVAAGRASGGSRPRARARE